MKPLYLSRFAILILLSLGCSWSSIAQSPPPYTTPSNSPYNFTIPNGVTAIAFDVVAAAGGTSAYNYGNGGAGGRVQGTLAVTSGQVLSIYVGGKGASLTGSYNASGAAGGVGGAQGGNSGRYYYPGGGGGSSEIRVGGTALSFRKVVAGGGGGGGSVYCNTEHGGAGGNTVGATGQICASPTYLGACYNATGGSQTGGGVATCNGAVGTQSAGSMGAYYAGGGGGGYWGGGGGYYYSGGGGGSSYTDGTVMIGTPIHTQGYNGPTSTSGGNGSVTICVPNVGVIIGAGPVCVGATLPLSATGVGGTWTSDNSSIASVDPSTGVVTGVSAGTANITYAVNIAGCGAGFVTASILVNPAPAVITGIGTACPGTTTALADATGGGTWSSGSTSTATVVSGTGVVTGVAAGIVPIIYTLTSTGCSIARNITINPLPAPISGLAAVCASGGTTSLTDIAIGGSWTSGTTSIATITGGGVVTGVSAGASVITYTLPTGCQRTLTVTVNPLPASITGFPIVCEGLTTTLVSGPGGGTWSSSNTAQAAVGATTGIVAGITAGTPTITYTLPTGCKNTIGIVVNPSPAAITGVSSMCTGASTTLASTSTGGVWTSSNNSVATVAGGSVSGIAPGTATITYTLGTGCATTTSVLVNALPTAYNITGGGGYCTGGTGVHIGLSFSSSGVDYKLYNGGTLVPPVYSGSNSGLDFGLQTATGTYTATAINSSTGCTNNMTGSVTVAVNTLPNVYTVSGGGNFCPGGAGAHVTLSGSQLSVNYQLFAGSVAVGSVVAGLGSAIDFGPQTLPGVYTVVATNPSTGCSMNMASSATVGLNSVPTVYTLNSGGGYCAGAPGLDIVLDGSDLSTSYQLYLAGLPSGAAMMGTGSALHFGLHTIGAYTVVATNPATGCTSTMSGSTVITINPLPNVYIVTGGGSFCASGAGAHVGLNFSSVGINYQLYRNTTTAVGSPVAGTNAGLDFGPQTVAGTYTVVAIDGATGCQKNMSGSVNVTTNTLPTVFTVTGGGSYCTGSAGLHVGVSGSNPGTQYQLYYNGTPLGAAITGTGTAIDFGVKTAVGVYTVVATNTITSCVSNMAGSATINISALPTIYTVSSAGTTSTYCAGGTGIEILISGSDATASYQLYRGTSAVGTAFVGSGAAGSLGYQTTPGVYTVIATDLTSGCTRTMAGSVNVAVNPLPPVFAITGGGNYCDGSTVGVHIGLGGSSVGIDYQLFNGGGAVGSAVSGTGGAIDFGLQLAVDVYNVVATNQLTGCTNNMTGTVNVGTNPLPTVYTTGGSGSYCYGGAGVSLTLDGSDMGINYQVLYGGVPSGALVAGTGVGLTFAPRTGAGNYTVKAIDATTGCRSDMTGTETIDINPLPTAYAVSGGGIYCSGAAGMPVNLGGSVIGVSYQLYYMGVGGATMAGSGTSLGFGLQTGIGSYNVIATDDATGCTSNMTGSVSINIQPTPAAQAVDGGGNYCAGTPGVHVGLHGSESGIQYQLYRGATAIGGAVAGTGAALDFGIQTVAGTYTVVASPGGVCQASMTGSVSVNINSLPTIYPLTGGGSFCASGTGVDVAMTGSQSSVKYQLYLGGSAVGGLVTGTGSAVDFGLQTAVGVYSVKATDTVTGCMSSGGSATVNTLALPAVHNVTGGGNYCAGGNGVHITLDGSNTNINYRLYMGATPVGTVEAGTNTILDFGLFTAAGQYRIVGTDAATLCSNNMADTATVAIDAVLTPAVTVVAHPGVTIFKGQRDTIVASATNAGTPSYQWYVNGFIVPGATNNSFSSSQFANHDTVACAVTSNGTCGGVTTTRSVVLTVNSTAAVQHITASNSNMNVVPNPNKGTFNLTGDLGTNTDEELTLEVTDLVGHTIYSDKVTAKNGNVNTRVQLSNVANGMYILSVRSAVENKVFHILIEQ